MTESTQSALGLYLMQVAEAEGHVLPDLLELVDVHVEALHGVVLHRENHQNQGPQHLLYQIRTFFAFWEDIVTSMRYSNFTHTVGSWLRTTNLLP